MNDIKIEKNNNTIIKIFKGLIFSFVIMYFLING